MIEQISPLKTRILLGLLILSVCVSHLLFLAQIDYVVYDHDQWHTAKPALKGYYQLKEGRIGAFFSDMLYHHDGWPRYPAFTGYLTALVCYIFGLSEVVMRWPPLLFYLILIYFTYKCAKEIESEEAGLISVFILTTMPVIVFYSRLTFPAFLGAALYMGALYYMLKSDYFLNIRYCLLLGVFTGFCLLTHRVVFIPLTVIWLVAIAAALKRKKIASLRGFAVSFLAAAIISARFLAGYFKAYDEYLDLSVYNLFNIFNRTYNLERLSDYLIMLMEYFGYDNLIIFCLLIGAIYISRKKMKNTAKNKTFLFRRFAIGFFYFSFGIYILVINFSKMGYINQRYHQVITVPMAIVMGIYLSKRRPAIKNTFIFIKGLLLVSLSIMLIPRFGRSEIMEPFKRYYRLSYGEANGVIWSNIRFRKRVELDYFKEEIAKGDIALMRLHNYGNLIYYFGDLSSLSGRLQLNGIGKVISSGDANPSALYLIFHCLSYKKEDYQARKEKMRRSPNMKESALWVEEFINRTIADEIGVDEKISIIEEQDDSERAYIIENRYVFSNADILAKYLKGLNFKKAGCFKCRNADRRMYKVIFKCAENISKLDNDDNFKGWRRDWQFLRKVRE